MRVLELLDEIDEIIETSSSVPFSTRIVVNADEIREIVKDIRIELPEEIHKAQWIQEERQKILEDAKQEYTAVVTDAKRQAEIMVENSDIVAKAHIRADEIVRRAEEKSKVLTLNAFDYVDCILADFQEKMDRLNAEYFVDMWNKMENTFQSVNATLIANRNELKETAYNIQMADKDR